MDTVLGVSVTPTNVRSVLVEGRGADGATLGHDEYDVFEEVGAALKRAQDDAGDQNVASIGVTWSDDAELEASVVLDAMARAGLTGVSAVPLSDAVEALASSIGRVIGYQRTALCVVEPDTAAIAVVDTAEDSVDVLISHAIDTEEALIDWVGATLAEDMRPEGLFMVGSVPGLRDTASTLEAELKLPVFNPPEAELALAHGAALASADGGVLPFDFDVPVLPAKPRRNPVAAPLTMLVAGAVTFVVSLSIAVGDQLAPETVPTASAEKIQESRAVPQARPTPPQPAAPPAVEVPAPPVVAPVVAEQVLPPIEALPPEPVPEAVVPEYVPEYVPEAPAPPPAAVLPPPPPVYQAPVVPQPRSLWERFKDKLKPGPDEPEWQLAPGAVPPPGVPIPPG
ncbi:hypothetical protein BVC93_26760 [Mycobacterium sp. MS1601]|uniref:DUF7159 family protein n=1 Tax=Mycobacterium sp. MS1601 TaxID=1936029 RepID=UPI0009790846|nr:hypothetical protein [Mycobacterium sp. MS1601]AQA05390.1 hypothetical protein BVC93_26760 [Mycobacterium sp. MS1601]